MLIPQPSLPPQGSVQRAGSAARCPHRHRPRGAPRPPPSAAAKPPPPAPFPAVPGAGARCRAVARPRPLPLGRRRCGCSRRRALKERRGADRGGLPAPGYIGRARGRAAAARMAPLGAALPGPAPHGPALPGPSARGAAGGSPWPRAGSQLAELGAGSGPRAVAGAPQPGSGGVTEEFVEFLPRTVLNIRVHLHKIGAARGCAGPDAHFVNFRFLSGHFQVSPAALRCLEAGAGAASVAASLSCSSCPPAGTAVLTEPSAILVVTGPGSSTV